MTDFPDDQQANEQDKDPVRVALREAEKRAWEAEERAKANAKAARDYQFLKAGIDPDAPEARYFVKGYDGEMTPEAIRQEALAARLLTPPPRTDVPPAEQAEMRRFSDVAAGSQEAPDISDEEEYHRQLNAISPKDPHGAEKVEALYQQRRQRLTGQPQLPGGLKGTPFA